MSEGENTPKINKGWANLRPPKLGEIRNPTGTKVPKDVRELRRITSHDVDRKLHKLLQMDQKELQSRLESPDTKMIEKMLAMMIWRAVQHADVVRANFVLERAGCRLPPQVQPVALRIEQVAGASDGELLRANERAVAILAEHYKTLAEAGQTVIDLEDDDA